MAKKEPNKPDEVKTAPATETPTEGKNQPEQPLEAKGANTPPETEAAMSVNAELKAAIVSYAKTRPVFEGYKAAGTARNILRSMRPILPLTGRREPP